eukprot:GFYU01002920.1.p1 GENE.GFYU01002920.1~~GFYU01002920.1.p1  ORF type:complete len:534 (-),score=116.83 GFYU01002920.1:173-1774(-)
MQIDPMDYIAMGFSPDIVGIVLEQTSDYDQALSMLLELQVTEQDPCSVVFEDQKITPEEQRSPFLDLPDDILDLILSHARFPTDFILSHVCHDLRTRMQQKWASKRTLTVKARQVHGTNHSMDSSVMSVNSSFNGSFDEKECSFLQREAGDYARANHSYWGFVSQYVIPCIIYRELDTVQLKGDVPFQVFEALNEYQRELNKFSVDKCETLTNELMYEVAPALASVTTLEFSRCPNLTEDAFRFIGRECGNLLYLTINQCSMQDDLVHYLTSTCKSLTSLSLSNCKDVKFDGTSATKLTNLTSLKIAQSRRISKFVLIGSNLQTVDISSCDNLKFCSIESRALTNVKVTNCKFMTSMKLKCPNLAALCLSGCNKLSELKVETTSGADVKSSPGPSPTLAATQSVTTPEALSISAANVSPKGKAVLPFQPQLTEINLFGCRSLWNSDIQALLDFSGVALESLVLNGCIMATGVKVLSTSLRHLDLKGCVRLADVDVELDRTKIQFVDLNACKSLDKDHSLYRISRTLSKRHLLK